MFTSRIRNDAPIITRPRVTCRPLCRPPVRLMLDTAPALVPYLPALSLDHIKRPDVGGRKHAESRQRALAYAMEAAFSGYRRHHSAPGASYFHSRALAAWLHTGKSGARAEALLAPFFDFPRGRSGFHVGRGEAKPYTLRDQPAAALDVVLGGDVPRDAYLDREHGERTPFAALPACGMPAELAGTFPVPRVLPLPMDTVEGALATVQEWGRVEGWHAPADPAKGGGSFTLWEAGRMLRAVRSWTRSVGGLPNLYQMERSGRIGGVGLSVVTLPRVLRALLFAGGPLADFDLQASNWRLYVSTARACGFATPAADEYLGNRAAHHALWSTVTGQPEPAVKQVPLGWLTGATLSAHPECAAVRALGAESFARLTALPFVRALYDETAATMPRICAELLPSVTDGRGLAYVNAVGGVRTPDSGKPDLSDGQKAAHFLTGLEQFAMRAIGPHVRELAAVVFDGLLAPAQDASAWPGIVKARSVEALGYALDVAFVQKPFATVVRPSRGAESTP